MVDTGGDSVKANTGAKPNLGKSDGETVVFSHPANYSLPMNILKPKPEHSVHRCIVLIHGGGWVGGTMREMDDLAHFFAERGFLTASVTYRLAPKDIWPAQLDDVQTAVRYIRTHAKELDISGEKIGAAGVSAGGHLSLFLGSVETRKASEYAGISSRVQAVGSISGIHDLNSPMTTAGEQYRIVQALTGEGSTVNQEIRSQASPLTFVDSKTAPTMFIQGRNDPLVPAAQTNLAASKLKQLGVPTEALFIAGMEHGISSRQKEQAKALDQLAAWMMKYLK